jgi:protocatechuate 3,4-dioxygenase beta subunit
MQSGEAAPGLLPFDYMTSSRRRFLAGLATALGAARAGAWAWQDGGLGQFTVAGATCKPETATPAVPADATFKRGSPLRTSLRDAAVIGTPLVLTGSVSGLSCGRIKGADVDFWQADARGVYDTAGYRLRGHQLTDAQGLFHLDTIVPGPAPGRARHIGVHVQVTGKASFWTELFFADDPQNARDPRFKPELVIKPVKTATGQAGTFDIVLDM